MKVKIKAARRIARGEEQMCSLIYWIGNFI